VSKETAHTLTQFFRGVVDRGTGVSARIPELAIAGKTGTSRKFIDGRYEAGAYTASFVGYFPADNPKVVCLVMIDHPRVGGYTGGLVSAPIFKEIARKIYAVSGRFSRQPNPPISSNQELVVPDVRNVRVAAAREILGARGYVVEIRGEGNIVQSQDPGPGTMLKAGKTVSLNMAGKTNAPGYALVPDLRGLSIRRAINTLVMQHLDIIVAGSGVVTAQSPRPGEQVKLGTRVLVRCTPGNASVSNL
jgi:membrane peptidoglycan carboxypeptidase